MLTEIDQKIEKVYRQWVDIQEQRLWLPLIGLLLDEVERTDALYTELLDLIKVRPGRYPLTTLNFNLLENHQSNKGFSYGYEYKVGIDAFTVSLESSDILVKETEDDKNWVDIEGDKQPLLHLCVDRLIRIGLYHNFYNPERETGDQFSYQVGIWSPEVLPQPRRIRIPDLIEILIPHPYSESEELPIVYETVVIPD